MNLIVATVSGEIYQLESSTTLAPLSWSAAGAAVTASGPSTAFSHTARAGDLRRFYRVRVVNP